MQYVMFMIPAVPGTEQAEGGTSAEMIEAMTKCNSELAETGIVKTPNRPRPPGRGVRPLFGPQGSTVSTDGAGDGCWILNVDSHDAAVAWASRCPAQDGDILEVRRIQQSEDFPEDARVAASGLDL